MSHAFSNRKKVRGWPRRLRRLAALRPRAAVPDEGALRGRGYDYVRPALDPWDRLVPRNPPAWLRRRMLGVLLDLHAEWHRHLTARGEPFYLAVWLFEPRFYRSQLVAAVGDRIGYYETLFPDAPGAPAEPPATYRAPGDGLDRLAWTPGLDADYVFRSSLGADPAGARWLARRRHRVVGEEALGDGDRMYVMRLGSVWVGRERRAKATLRPT